MRRPLPGPHIYAAFLAFLDVLGYLVVGYAVVENPDPSPHMLRWEPEALDRLHGNALQELKGLHRPLHGTNKDSR